MSASAGAPIPLEGRQGSTGIGGSFQAESVATFAWNRWQGSTGISGNLRAEYALLYELRPVAGQIPDIALPLGRDEARLQQAKPHQFGEPAGIGFVGLAAWDV